MPKRALPSCLAAASCRRIGLPIRVNWSAVFSTGWSGSGSLAARSASSPKRSWRLLAAWRTTPWATLQSATGTPQAWAAAATSMARALAPASRIGIHKSLTLDEPPVACRPNSRMVLAVMWPARRLMVPSLSGWKGRPSTTVARLL